MKKTRTVSEKSLDITKEEQTIEPKAAPKTKATSAAVPKAESVTAAAKIKKASKKPAAKPTATQKTETETQNLTITERVGLTAGSIWHYLSKNGATSVSKLVTALVEDEKIIQRSIGWLAQEDKIEINLVNRIETISLKS